MKPEGISSSSFCLVSPAQDIAEGDRIWIEDGGGNTSIKRLVQMTGDRLVLRGWMPAQDGKQHSFDEERMTSYVVRAHPIVAVFRGKPGSDNVVFVPDPRDEGQSLSAAINESEFGLVRLHDVQASAGSGMLALDGPDLRSIAFPKDWLRSEGLTSSNAALIFVEGDSMEPTLHDKSVVMINLNRRTPVQRRIYAFRHDGELFVKRLDLSDDGMIVISSDNPVVPTRVVTPDGGLDFEVIGEVVWAARDI